jgi:hypothetical protein
MDISDILTSVSHPHLPAPNTTTASTSHSNHNHNSRPRHPRTLDQQALTRAWINERISPELLPYPTDLIERCTRAIAGQIEILEGMASGGGGGGGEGGDHNTGEDGGGFGYGYGGAGAAGGGRGVFDMVVLQTELERFRFLLRGFLRGRIGKVSFPLHLFLFFFSFISFFTFFFGGVLFLEGWDERDVGAEEEERWDIYRTAVITQRKRERERERERERDRSAWERWESWM